MDIICVKLYGGFEVRYFLSSTSPPHPHLNNVLFLRRDSHIPSCHNI